MGLPVRRDRVLRALRRAGPGLTLAVLWLVVLRTGVWGDERISDLFVYGSAQDLLRAGFFPYRELAFEYPPLALAPIGLLGDSETGWHVATLLFALATQEGVRGLGGERAAWALCALPFLTGALARLRFDLLPAALAVGGLALVVRRRPAAGGVLLGLGALAKLWPALLAAVAVSWLLGRREREAALRVGAAAAVVVLAGAVAVVATGGADGAWASLVRFHLDRPVQIESIPASLLFALGGSSVTGDPVRPDPYKSNGLDGGSADLVATCAGLAQVAAILLVLRLVHRRRDEDALVLGALGAVLAFVGLGKVLSPQFLLWLLPLAAVAFARGHVRIAALVAAASAVTLTYFPDRYFDLVARDDGVVATVALRNALLLAALVATARALARSRRPASAASSG